MIVEGWKNFISFFVQDWLDAEVDGAVGELVYNRTKTLCISKVIHLLTKTEFVYDVLNVFTVAVKVFDKVHLQAFRINFGLQFLHRKT